MGRLAQLINSYAVRCGLPNGDAKTGQGKQKICTKPRANYLLFLRILKTGNRSLTLERFPNIVEFITSLRRGLPLQGTQLPTICLTMNKWCFAGLPPKLLAEGP